MSPARSAAIGLTAGLTATMVKSLAEPRLQSLVESRFPPSSREKKLIGADPADQPENMPPAAAIRKVGRALTGAEPSDNAALKGQQAIHLAFGTGFGLLYSFAGSRRPAMTRGFGIPAGATLYAATHASTLPALGLQPPPTSMPRAAVIWEAGSHLVYGVTLEITRRALSVVSAHV